MLTTLRRRITINALVTCSVSLPFLSIGQPG
jgi:hypothetical protein